MFESAPCPQRSPAIQALATARCGYLVVPENRSKRNGRTIRLAVATIPSAALRPAPDPIVFLNGGPGSDSFAIADALTKAGLNRDRDVIVLAQRGTAGSTPYLSCPEISDFLVQRVGLDYSAASTVQRYVRAAAACRRRLAASGVDLSAYNTTESAADVAGLRTALGIPQWNVLGHSYGTDLALNYMRSYPQGVRSVTLDGVTPPDQVTLGWFWSNLKGGFDNMVAACAAQPACETRYPGIGPTFIRLVSELQARPMTTTVTVPGVAAPVKVVLDGGALLLWVVAASHNPTELPLAVDELAHGHPERIAATYAETQITPDGAAVGDRLSIVCQEWVPFQSASDQLRDGRGAFPSFPAAVQAQPAQGAFFRQVCPAWKVAKAPASVRALTKSTIPTLVMSGSFDVQTGAQWGPYVARTLANSTVVTVPGVAHGVFNESPCGAQVEVSFFDNPKAPDTSCVASQQPAPFVTTGPSPLEAPPGGPLPSEG
jgi:pimeloyl-ACP methyl ester carboxylesterase